MTTPLTEPASDHTNPGDLARRLALLEAVTAALGEDLDLTGLLDRVLATVRDVTGVSGGGIFLFEERTGELRLVVHQGISDEMAASFAENPGERLRRLAVDPRAPLIVQNLTDP